MDPSLAVAFLLGALAHYLFGPKPAAGSNALIEQNNFYDSEPAGDADEPEDVDDDGEEWRQSL